MNKQKIDRVLFTPQLIELGQLAKTTYDRAALNPDRSEEQRWALVALAIYQKTMVRG